MSVFYDPDPPSKWESRPWGRMRKLLHTKRLWVKIIIVDPHQCTSLQYHKDRAEFHFDLDRWSARLVRRGDIHSMHQGRYLEIAWGQPDEKDIVRLTDLYGRKTPCPAPNTTGFSTPPAPTASPTRLPPR